MKYWLIISLFQFTGEIFLRRSNGSCWIEFVKSNILFIIIFQYSFFQSYSCNFQEDAWTLYKIYIIIIIHLFVQYNVCLTLNKMLFTYIMLVCSLNLVLYWLKVRATSLFFYFGKFDCQYTSGNNSNIFYWLNFIVSEIKRDHLYYKSSLYILSCWYISKF